MRHDAMHCDFDALLMRFHDADASADFAAFAEASSMMRAG